REQELSSQWSACGVMIADLSSKRSRFMNGRGNRRPGHPDSRTNHDQALLIQSRALTTEPVPPEIASIELPSPQLLKYYVLQAIATTIAFPLTMLLLYFRYHTMRYRFDAEGIHMRWGILLRREVMLNYSRIQDIQLRSNVIERWLG